MIVGVQRLLAILIAGAVAMAPAVGDACTATRRSTGGCCCSPTSRDSAAPSCCHVTVSASTACVGERQIDPLYVHAAQVDVPSLSALRPPPSTLITAREAISASGVGPPLLRLRI